MESAISHQPQPLPSRSSKTVNGGARRAGLPLIPATPAALLERFDRADARFERVLADVRKHGGWDDTFVDALCEPPETFTFGGMFAHVVTYNSYRRLMAALVMRQFGVEDVGFGDPIEYERSASQAAAGAK